MKATPTQLGQPLKLTALLMAAQGLVGTGLAQEATPAEKPEPVPSPENKPAPEKKVEEMDTAVETAKTEGNTAAQKLDTVVVKGQRAPGDAPTKVESPKYPQPLLDTPKTIQVIPQEVIKEQAATTLSDVLRNTPGIMMVAGEGGGANSTAGDAFYMRGFDASNSVFVDGVRNTGAISRDVFNYEQVEVVKGPGGENGRGVASGYINLVTKAPQQQRFGSATLSYGFSEVADIERKRATVDLNSGVIEESPIPGTALRFNALWQDGGVAGRDYVEQNSVGIAPSLAFGLGTDTRAIITYQYIDQDNIPDYGVPAVISKDLAAPANYMPGVNPTNFYGLVDYDHEDIKSHNVGIRLEHDFSDNIKLTNFTSYTSIDRFSELTSPNSYNAGTALVNRSHQINDRVTQNVSNLTNLLLKFETGSLAHTVTTGVDYSHENAQQDTWTGLGTTPGGDLYHPNVHDVITGYAPVKSGAWTRGTTDNVGIYVYDSIEFNKKWILDGGARLDYYNTQYLSNPATGSTTPASKIQTDDVYATWKAALTYKPRENGSIYIATGTSIRPPGTNLTFNTGATNADNPSLDPQEAYNFEVGTKWDFYDGRFSPTLAIFRNQNTNIAYTDPVTGNVSQQRDQIVQGFELGATGRITPQWLLYAGFAYMDTQVTKQTTISPTGDAMPLAPEFSGSLWTTYRFEEDGVTIGLGAQYVGSANRLQTSGTNSLSTPAYWLFNAMVAWDITENFTVQLNINNIFDEEYVRSYNNNGNRANLGTPRNYTVSATVRF